MKQILQMMGGGNAFTDFLNTQAYFKVDDTINFIDCGERNAHKTIDVINSFDNIKKYNFIITHLHSDHIGSIGTVLSYLALNEESREIHIYTKDIDTYIILDTSLRFQLSAFPKINYQVHLISYKKFKLNKDISFRFIPTKHVKSIKSYGILIEDNSQTYMNTYFSGDSNSIPKGILKRLEDNTIQAYYQDIDIKLSLHYQTYLDMYGKDYDFPHMALRVLRETLPQSYKGIVHPMHFNGYNFKNLDVSEIFSEKSDIDLINLLVKSYAESA